MSGIGFVKKWVLPPRIYEFITQCYLDSTMKISSYKKETLVKNAIFKDKYNGKRCFVIANGPSLNTQDLSSLKDEITIVMNKFQEHPILEFWKPTFYCMADPIESFTDDRHAHECRDFLKTVTNKIVAEGYFLPYSIKSLIEEQNSFPQQNTYYFIAQLSLQKWLRKNLPIDFTTSLPPYQNTAQLAIYLAMYLGCNPIYLLGFDHDYLAHVSEYPHFYKPVYNMEKDVYGKEPYYDRIKIVAWVWEIYYATKENADNNGIQIFNATNGGFLDVFPRKQYETLFNQ